jgi:iron-sulfur cluster protein
MSDSRYTYLTEKIHESINNPNHSKSLYNAMKRGRDSRKDRLAEIPGGDSFRQQVKERKNICRGKSDELTAEFIKNAEKRGVTVFEAKDGAEAIAYILNIAKENNAQTVSKSKSLTTEEIELNEPLEEAGLRVVETDLGELIIQLVNEKPYHLVFPSVHKTAAEVAEIFTKETGEDVPTDIKKIMNVVRKYLRPIFLNTDIGLTGANIGIAETGGIVIETNEGNARLVSSIGNTHICVMGKEKIVETVEDALLMVMAHPVSATGQMPTTYVTWLHGRSPLGEGENQPRESHIIILDNGRTEMAQDSTMQEALNCIRCGACMNICPTYGVVGGHTFGHIYPGPVGIPWTSQVHGQDLAADFAPLCISCGLCKEICPADINLPMMIAEVKHRDHTTNSIPTSERTMMKADEYASLGSSLAPFSNWGLKNPVVRGIMDKFMGVDKRRNLPPFDRNTLSKRHQHHSPSKIEQPKEKVLFFSDIFAQYNRPDLGMAAIQLLESNDCEVQLAEPMSSGYPYIAYGDLDKARSTAQKVVDYLHPWVSKGYTIVSTEPTAVYTIYKSYPYLLDNSDKSLEVSKNTREFFNLLNGLNCTIDVGKWKNKTFGFHCSCHQRPLGSGNEVMEWMKSLGLNVARVETGTCCGMGGTFGMKSGALGYELSQAVGKPLFDMFKEANVDAIVTESSVCSIQLGEGCGIPTYHPLEIIQSFSEVENE